MSWKQGNDYDTGSMTADFTVPLYYSGAMIWLTGILVHLMRFGRSAFHTRAIIRASRALPEDIARSANILNGKIPVYCSDQISSPLVTGFRRQIILLPEQAQLAPEELTTILHHEYGHIHRNDMRIMVIQKILSTFFWWNPILYMIVGKLNQAREMACDERAVLKMGNVRDYTRCLLSSAKKTVSGQYLPLTVGIFHSGKILTQRIERLTNMNILTLKQTKKTSLLWSLGIIFIVAGTAYIFSSRLVAANQSPAQHARILSLAKTAPVYPEAAVEQKLEGDVVLKFDITQQGRTENLVIIESSNKIFNTAALDAARKFTYKSRPDGKVIRNVLHKISFRMNNQSITLP